MPGFEEFSVPIKPIANFLVMLNDFIERLKGSDLSKPSVFIIGAGVAGVELALSLRRRFSSDAPDKKVGIHIAHSGNLILPELSNTARKLMEKELNKSDISLSYNATVKNLTNESIYFKESHSFPCQLCIVCSHAQAPKWPGESGLQVDENGFILVNQHLRSLSHPKVFAAGDIAQLSGHRLPRAGVYAVRQSKPLAINLYRSLSCRGLVKFRPQKNFLKLIGAGKGKALAVKSGLHFYGKFPWKLKQSIDQKFMQGLSPKPSWLENMQNPKAPGKNYLSQNAELAKTLDKASMRCSGCAAKWDEGVLSEILNSIRCSPNLKACLTDPDNPHSFLKADDAAAFTPIPDHDLVQSIDFMPSITSDPFLFGRILVNHSFNDIYAMGARPHSAQALIMLPYMQEKIAIADGKLLMQGIASQLIKIGSEVKLIGGHTCEGSPLSAGLVCNGVVKPKSLLTKGGFNPGDKLVLTKPIGTGVIFAASMRLAAHSHWLDSATISMLRDHSCISRSYDSFPVTGATDISGFGLLGHLLEMQFAAKRNVKLSLEQVPILPGAYECLAKGIRSSLHAKNAKKQKFLKSRPSVDHNLQDILFDPQTSGPLLIALHAESASAFMEHLKSLGFRSAAIIGEVDEGWTPASPISLT